jgi:hypothetical protein
MWIFKNKRKQKELERLRRQMLEAKEDEIEKSRRVRYEIERLVSKLSDENVTINLSEIQKALK